ncbi:MAG: hypothetical protein NTU54_04660 [Candidatus Omnitrophica bacterium]|nr:hypothetical protein [Candidatus Omnitrophota bacterium]
MRLKTVLILTAAFCFMSIGATYVFSQEESIQGQTGGDIGSEAKTQSFSGDVVSVDAQSKMIVLKHLNSETGQDEVINIYADEKTVYQNVGSFEGINPKDNLSIDYIVNTEGKNIAKNVNLAKQEVSIPEAAPSNDTVVTP